LSERVTSVPERFIAFIDPSIVLLQSFSGTCIRTMTSSTGKFFSMIFNAGQRTIDPATFTVSQFNNVHSASDAIALFRFAIDSKNDEYLKASLNMIYRLCQEDNQKPSIAVQLGDLGVCSMIDSVFGSKYTDIQIANHCLQVMYVLMLSSEQPSSLNASVAASSQRRTSSSDVSSSVQLSLFGNPSTSPSGSASAAGVASLLPTALLPAGSASAVDPTASNRKKLSGSSLLIRMIKCGQIFINEVSLLLAILKVLKEFMIDTSK
jgi:hypothetical protein